MQKHSQHNKDERTHFFRKTYLSLYSKWLRKSYVWEVSWTLNKAATLWPPVLLATAALLSRSAGLLNRGLGGPALCWDLVLTPRTATTDSKLWLQLTPTSRCTGLYNCLTPTCFSERRSCTQFNPSTVKVIPWYLRPDAPVIYTSTFLIWQFGRVGGQYVTLIYVVK